MMELSYGYASFARWGKRHLTLHLSAELFGTEGWEAIKAWYAVQSSGLHWLKMPPGRLMFW